jgi:hypothetical protein
VAPRWPPDEDTEFDDPESDDPESEEWEDLMDEFPSLDGLDQLDDLDHYIDDEDAWYD